MNLKDSIVRGLLSVIVIIYSESLDAVAQRQSLDIGASLSLIKEKRSAKIYGPGLVQKTSETINAGFGIKTSYLRNNLRLGLGLSFIERNYKMVRPFNHCYFKPGEPCDYILAHVDRYSYQTVEVPLSLDLKIFNTERFSYYLGGSYTNAFLLQSEYHASYLALGTKKQRDNFEKFSESFYGQIGIAYRMENKIFLLIQPLVRVNCKQKGDQILMESGSWLETSFDSFGVILGANYRLGK
jgi:hypothetical protein